MGWTICWKCKERFGLADETEAMLRRSGRLFCCPWGHSAVFSEGEPEIDTIRRERDQLKQRIAYKEDMIREAEARAERERRRANGYKGHATRITKRAKAGVCPCCNRTFKQLAQHMANKHPQFTPMELEDRPPEGATVQ
jgi:hypothetical protein